LKIDQDLAKLDKHLVSCFWHTYFLCCHFALLLCKEKSRASLYHYQYTGSTWYDCVCVSVS